MNKIAVSILIAWLFITNSMYPLAILYANQQLTAKTKEKPNPNLISLNLKDVDIEHALKIVAEASGMNIVLDKDVKAKVSIIIKNVHWQTALENILKTNELTYRIQDNIIRVMTLATVKKELELVPLVTKIITLNFARTEIVQKSLSKMLSSRGTMEVNIPTNSLIVTDAPENLAKIEEIANRLDVRTPQVMIEALIMSVKLTDTDKFGIDWTMTHKTISSRKILQDLEAPSAAWQIKYGKTILNNWNIDAAMSVYSQDKRVNILASPRVLTLDNLSAQIEITEQVPYTYVSQSTEGGAAIKSTQFKDVGIKLYVTPHITKDKFISLSVRAEQSFVASFVGDTNEPSVDSRRAETNFMLKDGQTVIIGGLRKKDSTVTVDKVPILGDIPLLGRLFKKEIKEITNTELFIFITPRIVEEVLMTQQEEKKFQKASAELSPVRNKIIIKTLDKLSKYYPKKTKK